MIDYHLFLSYTSSDITRQKDQLIRVGDIERGENILKKARLQKYRKDFNLDGVQSSIFRANFKTWDVTGKCYTGSLTPLQMIFRDEKYLKDFPGMVGHNLGDWVNERKMTQC